MTSAVLVNALLAHQPVVADGQPVVAHKHHDRIIPESPFLQGVEDLPDAEVEMADHAVVVGDVTLYALGPAGIFGEVVVASAAAPAAVDGRHLEEVVGKRYLFRIVHRAELFRHRARVVRRHVREVNKER